MSKQNLEAVATLRLQKGADKRLKSLHPWVYSNEIQTPGKQVAPGSIVQIQDAAGAFVAHAYYNPHTLIAARVLSRESKPFEFKNLVELLLQARALRSLSGATRVSHRLIFGEADGLPGVVIEAFQVPQAGWVYVLQLNTQGAEALAPVLEDALRDFVKLAHVKGQVSLLVRRDSSARKIEGLKEEPTQAVGLMGDTRAPEVILAALSSCRVEVMEQGAHFDVDLVNGQKTGFFLDQSYNVQKSFEATRGMSITLERPFKILDLCTYVGQWSALWSRHLTRLHKGLTVEVHAVDASVPAFELAKSNIKRAGGEFHGHLGDVFEILEKTKQLKDREFDLVICDPPALIKSKKDLGPGTAAYVKLNQAAMGKVRPGGVYVTSSCSHHLGATEFWDVLAKAERRSGRIARYIAQGGHGPDHPVLAGFPEGRYLKTWIAQIT